MLMLPVFSAQLEFFCAMRTFLRDENFSEPGELFRATVTMRNQSAVNGCVAYLGIGRFASTWLNFGGRLAENAMKRNFHVELTLVPQENEHLE